MIHIICYSGGWSSGTVAYEVRKRYPNDRVVLLNHNINPKYEDVAIKNFKRELAAALGLPITYANMNGIQDENLIPSQFDIALKLGGFKQPGSGNALCTYYLKTLPFNQYLAAEFPLKDCVVYYGFDDDEQERIVRRDFILGQMGYKSDYPLARWPSTIEDLSEIGIARPATYAYFRHGNCVGCLKAGLQHWYTTFVRRPDVYAEGVNAENVLGYTLLRRMEKGVFRPISLTELAFSFQKMFDEGIEASEYTPRGPFLKALKKYGLQYVEDAKVSCECGPTKAELEETT